MDAALVATVMADRRPARALRDHIEVLALDGTAAADVRAAALFESVFYRLPPFGDDRLPQIAAMVFRRLGRDDAARLLDGLAAQMQTPHPPPAEPEAAQIVAAPEQGDALLGALERYARTQDWAGSARLFDTVWPCLRPTGQYWVYYRMSAVCAALGRHDAARLLAAIAVQIEPASHVAREPYARLFEAFSAAGRRRDAAELALRQCLLCPHAALLTEDELAKLLTAAGKLAAPPSPPPPAQLLFGREERPAQLWRCYGNGVPNRLAELRRPMVRDAVSITELRDAEVLVADNTVAVLSADGAIRTELSVGPVPTLLVRRFAELARAGQPPTAHRLAAAVLAIDQFPAPNLGHFLLDHASRLLLYRAAGIDLGAVTAIGPALTETYQKATVNRIGVANWHATDAPARLLVARLFVSSNCRQLQHSAHLGAPWAVAGVRALFDTAPRARHRRLLISRADAKFRRIVNEPAIAGLLAPLGFETIIPGALSLGDQIAAFRDATHVVGPHGAGLANILFCAPGTHVLEAFHPHYGTWTYAILGPSLGLHYASLVAHDALSDAAEFNDPAWPLAERNVHSGRDLRVDPVELARWLADSGAL